MMKIQNATAEQISAFLYVDVLRVSLLIKHILVDNKL